jgi:hypothetical protein
MRTTKLTTALTTGIGALALASAALLSACGADATPEASGAGHGYCDQLGTDKAYFDSLDGSDPDVAKLDDAFDRMHALAAIAPAAVADDWAVLDDAITAIEDALDDAGLSFDDLAAMQDGDVPADVDLEKLSELGTTMEALSGGQLDAAAARIAEHADDVCGIDLQLT